VICVKVGGILIISSGWSSKTDLNKRVRLLVNDSKR